MKIDLAEKIEITRWQLIQLVLIFLSLGAGATLLNPLLGLVIVGTAILIFALPLITKIWESSTK